MGSSSICYPIARETGKYSYPSRGREFRLDFKFRSFSETKEMFYKLIKGNLSLFDLREYVSNESLLNYI